MSVVSSVYIDTIEELHEFLSPIGPYKHFFIENERYLFRGEGSIHYPLNPSLFRGESIRTLYRSLRKPPVEEAYYTYEETYQWIELMSLIKFFDLANNAGIPVPNSDILKGSVLHWHEAYQPNGDVWLPEELLDLFSLARHYSFPTRMLDWSDNIYTALYFACSNALNREGRLEDDGLVIYALHLSRLLETEFPIRFVRPLRAYNENARAQGGVLSYIETENLLKDKPLFEKLPPLKDLSSRKINRTPLDDQLEQYFHEKDDVPHLLHKIIINGAIVPELYLYLESLHYSAEKIYPDLYGVVRKMLEDEAHWSKHKEN